MITDEAVKKAMNDDGMMAMMATMAKTIYSRKWAAEGQGKDEEGVSRS